MHTLRFDGWKLNIHFSAAHCIPFHSKCERLHGHHYAVHCEIEGELDTTGWVMDFGPVKKALKRIADRLDHRVIIPTAPGEFSHEVKDGQVHMTVVDKHYVFPEEDCVLVAVPTSTAEHLAALVLEELVGEIDFPANVRTVRVGVDEGYGQGAWTEWYGGTNARSSS
ncbi:MAG: 6-pyruvoyl tetrahydropterin synthase family protein [Euryarchaeota archaeon]|nr:6-pyruvoyl tetrahydropterin synthase family protein [Euryarchaeota archaeon]